MYETSPKTRHFNVYIFSKQAGASIHKKIENVSFLRVRVVRVTQSACQVYGVDTGILHECRVKDLVLLPASIINLPPCGRLARLPGQILIFFLSN